MTLTDDFDLNKLRQAHLEIQQLEAAAIDRARLYLETTGASYANFHNANGFSVTVNRNTLLDASVVDVIFIHTDVQGKGYPRTIRIPRSIILGALTTEEQEFSDYKLLKAKFEK